MFGEEHGAVFERGADPFWIRGSADGVVVVSHQGSRGWVVCWDDKLVCVFAVACAVDGHGSVCVYDDGGGCSPAVIFDRTREPDLWLDGDLPAAIGIGSIRHDEIDTELVAADHERGGAIRGVSRHDRVHSSTAKKVGDAARRQTRGSLYEVGANHHRRMHVGTGDGVVHDPVCSAGEGNAAVFGVALKLFDLFFVPRVECCDPRLEVCLFWVFGGVRHGLHICVFDSTVDVEGWSVDVHDLGHAQVVEHERVVRSRVYLVEVGIDNFVYSNRQRVPVGDYGELEAPAVKRAFGPHGLVEHVSHASFAGFGVELFGLSPLLQSWVVVLWHPIRKRRVVVRGWGIKESGLELRWEPHRAYVAVTDEEGNAVWVASCKIDKDLRAADVRVPLALHITTEHEVVPGLEIEACCRGRREGEVRGTLVRERGQPEEGAVVFCVLGDDIHEIFTVAFEVCDEDRAVVVCFGDPCHPLFEGLCVIRGVCQRNVVYDSIVDSVFCCG